MAVIRRLSSKATPAKIVKYLTQEGKTNESLISGKDCNPHNVVNEFTATQELYSKTDGVRYHHIIQSFFPGEITPEKAHELGKELADNMFKGHEVFIVTHTDKEHIHNHFVVNSVSFESGKKYKSSNKSLWDIKRESNRICQREHLKILDLNHKAKERLTSAELRIELRGGTPWKKELKECIDFAKSKANTFDDFRKYLKDNFNISTRVTNKTISYQHPDKSKHIRGSKLGADYDKEDLINGFIRKEKSIIREGYGEPTIEGNRGIEEVPTRTPNVDWSAIKNNVEGQGNRVSKQLSDDVTGKIQRKVRGIKERTERATGISEPENKELTGQQQPIEAKHEREVTEHQQERTSRDWELER